jgi:hypothetical protein
MSDDLPVTALVTRAANADQQAWGTLVERYAPLIWSICRRYQLGGADAEDVGQAVWLQLAGHLGKIRDPAAIAGWPPRPGGNTSGSCAPHQDRRLPGTCRPSRSSQTNRPGRRSRNCWRPSGHAALREAVTRLPPLPAADSHAGRRPACAVRPDQRQAGYPGWQHRATPRPLPGQAAPRSGNRCADQPRSRVRWKRAVIKAGNGAAVTISQ